MSVYDPKAFQERVNFAASVITAKRPTTRHFDTCFEMGDGDKVAAALWHRVDRNPHTKLAANIARYIIREVPGCVIRGGLDS